MIRRTFRTAVTIYGLWVLYRQYVRPLLEKR
jgi:hypothetical protein